MAKQQATGTVSHQFHDRDEALEEKGLVRVLVGEDAMTNNQQDIVHWSMIAAYLLATPQAAGVYANIKRVVRRWAEKHEGEGEVRLIRRKFESWLRAKPPTEIVGGNRDCHACPLALFYEQTSGGCEVVISSDRNGFGYVIDRGCGERKMPAWASAFVFLVDGDTNGKISAGRSLEIMGQIS